MRIRHIGAILDRSPVIPYALITVVILIWFWPITLWRGMPVGGDVTSFFMPLMSYYRQALLDGRVPVWNELWGFGFPMLAESQAGVFYPPHLILFGMFETETAYCLNLVVHSVLAGWFMYVCGRQFGLRRGGATLAALAFAGNGFFIIHFPHQWSYTTACWMPLAVSLAWRAVGGESARRSTGVQDVVPAAGARRRVHAAFGLAAVLAVQMLAGHFQIAFYTQVVVLSIGVWGTGRWLVGKMPRDRKRASPQRSQDAGGAGVTALLWVALPLGIAFMLAAVQLLPTRELIALALPEGRDFEYLSGFANTPLHLVSYLLPTLFHVSPLWRPVAWDPFHTSPEECFSYIGLWPLCLATGAAWRWRREPRVRLWVLLVVITLLLSLGPYQPLFRGLIGLPGFDGFRSSARWSVATALFLALLAGRALDHARSVERLVRWLRRLLIVCVAIVVVYVAAIVLFVHSSKLGPTSWSWRMVQWSAQVWQVAGPWDEPGDVIFRAARAAHEPRGHGLADTLPGVLSREVLPPLAGMAGIWICLCCLPKNKPVPRWVVLGLVALDLGVVAWLRPTEFVSRGRLVQQSSALQFLHEHARGERVSGLQPNLAMLAGAASLDSYRTVDIPFATLAPVPDAGFTAMSWNEHVQDRCGVAWEVWPAAWGMRPGLEGSTDTVLRDPLLARMVGGTAGSARAPSPAATGFVMRHRGARTPARGWFLSAGDLERLEPLLERKPASGRPSDRTQHWLYRPSLVPVAASRWRPGSMAFELDARGPGMLVVSELAYPGWRATIVAADGSAEAAETRVADAGCLLVRVPRAGGRRVQLDFQSDSFEQGRSISAFTWGLWVVTLVVLKPFSRRTR